MRILSGGNVGIGTDSPSAKFQVLGVGLQGMQAWFGNGFINTATYHYSFAKVGFSTSVSDGTETGAGFQFNTRNSSNTNWLHGYIYQPQNGGIAFGTGGAGTTQATEKMRITSAGNVAIGGTLGADSQFRVELKPAGTILAGLRVGYNGTSYNYYDADNQYFRNGLGTINRMVIDSSGNVGIGTSTISATLHVQSTSTADLKVITTGAADAAVKIQGYDAGVHIGDATNGLRWAVWNDGPSTSSSLKFGSYALGTWYGDASQVMTMESSGHVGIGTTNPAPKLHLVYSGGSYGTDTDSGFINQATTGRATQRLRSITDNPAELFFDVNGAIRWDISVRDSSSSYDMNFYRQAASPAYNTVSNPSLILKQNGDVYMPEGNVGIGVTTTSYRLEVNGGFAATAITETSALKFKENITPLNSQLEIINKLNPVNFDWKEDGKKDFGFIADEVEEIIPELVSYKENEVHGLHYSKLTPILVKALQEQQTQIEELKQEIKKLKEI